MLKRMLELSSKSNFVLGYANDENCQICHIFHHKIDPFMELYIFFDKFSHSQSERTSDKTCQTHFQ